jgi:hypothetical protein
VSREVDKYYGTATVPEGNLMFDNFILLFKIETSNVVLEGNMSRNVKLFVADTIIMSHVFEHFYEPIKIIEMIRKNMDIEYVYICHPNFDAYVIEPTYNILHCEHTFYIENEFLVKLWEFYGFRLIHSHNINNYAIAFEFKRETKNTHQFPINLRTDDSLNKYHTMMFDRINHLNDIIDNTNKSIYIWPCSIHSVILFNFGLNYKKITAMLDNSPNKIDKYMYGYNLKCLSFKNIIEIVDKEIIIIMSGGCFNSEIVQKTNKNITFI